MRWDPKGGRAVATEQVTLYGLPIVSDRVIGYDRVDEAQARAWFITKALIERDIADAAWIGRQQFLTRNTEFLEHLRRMAARVRRLELVDDEMLFDFYADRIGAEVTSVRHFDKWWKAERQRRPDLLDLTDELVAGGRGHGVRLADYPDVWTQQRGSAVDRAATHVPLRARASRSTV